MRAPKLAVPSGSDGCGSTKRRTKLRSPTPCLACSSGLAGFWEVGGFRVSEFLWGFGTEGGP